MTDTTILALTGMGIPPYSARGLTQTLGHIDGAVQQRRTINGTLTDISDSLFQKYNSTISGSDQQPPALEGKWPGLILTVDCMVELAITGEVGYDTTDEPTTTEGSPFDRPVVPGSVRHETGFTFYRPRLTMMVTGFTVTKDEWGAAVDWSLALEEV